jgi:hypothetical protein
MMLLLIVNNQRNSILNIVTFGIEENLRPMDYLQTISSKNKFINTQYYWRIYVLMKTLPVNLLFLNYVFNIKLDFNLFH